MIIDVNRTVYVAASTHKRERFRVRSFTREVQKIGWKLSHDWLAFRELMESKGGATQIDTVRAIYQDLLGVRNANTFVFLVPEEGIDTNADVEFGIALGAKVPNMILSGGPEALSNRFFAGLSVIFPNVVCVQTDEAALDFLRAYWEQSHAFETQLGFHTPVDPSAS